MEPTSPISYAVPALHDFEITTLSAISYTTLEIGAWDPVHGSKVLIRLDGVTGMLGDHFLRQNVIQEVIIVDNTSSAFEDWMTRCRKEFSPHIPHAHLEKSITECRTGTLKLFHLRSSVGFELLSFFAEVSFVEVP